VTDPLDPDDGLDAELEARLRAHFADRTAREPLPGGDAPPLAPRAPRAWYPRPPMLAAAAAVLAVALVGALTLREDDPEELETTNPSTTTTAITAPDTTTTETTAPDATTTTVPDSSGVRSAVVSVDGVVGSWSGSRWVRWDEGPIPLEGGETYVLVRASPPTARVEVGSAPVPGCDVVQPPPWFVEIDGLGPPVGLEPPPVAVTGVQVPVPREAEEIGASAAHVEAASLALAGTGIEDPSPDLAQVLRVDFEGDGVDEVLLVAERLSDPVGLYAQVGDYSVLLLRQVIDGQAVTSVVDASHARPVSDGETPFVYVTRVAAVADFNGDGVMELATRSRYYEGAATAVRTVDPAGGSELVLEVGCGV
jgi:hypothetical protein